MDAEISKLERDALTGNAEAVRALARIARRAAGEGDDSVIHLPLVPSRVERGNARAVRNFAVAFTPGGGRTRSERSRKLMLAPQTVNGGFDCDILMRSAGEVATVMSISGRFVWTGDTDGKLILRVNDKLALETKR